MVFFFKTLALSTGKTRSSVVQTLLGWLATVLAFTPVLSPRASPGLKELPITDTPMLHLRFCQRGTGHPLQACLKHPLSCPASTHRPWKTELSLPKLPGFHMEPSVLPCCWLSLQELRKQVHEEALTKPPTFLLLAATRGHYRCILYIYVYCYQQDADDIKDGEFCCRSHSSPSFI